jgi:uncharacterized membrane protein YoaK (UPF0700 family)
MRKTGSRSNTLALCLSALTGYVDAICFIKVGGYFVFSINGDLTRLAVSFAQGSLLAGIAGLLVGSFVVGVMFGTLIGAKVPRHRRPTLLVLISALLALAASSALVGWVLCAGAIMALAMGTLNAVFEEDEQVYFGAIFMTGILVRLGQEIAEPTGSGFGWVPYLSLLLTLVAGATLGTVVCGVLSFGALWLAAVAAGLLGALTLKALQETRTKV